MRIQHGQRAASTKVWRRGDDVSMGLRLGVEDESRRPLPLFVHHRAGVCGPLLHPRGDGQDLRAGQHHARLPAGLVATTLRPAFPRRPPLSGSRAGVSLRPLHARRGEVLGGGADGARQSHHAAPGGESGLRRLHQAVGGGAN